MGSTSKLLELLFFLCHEQELTEGQKMRHGQKNPTSQMGLEPTVFGSGNRRLVHLATGTYVPEVGFESTRTDAQQILSLPLWTSRASRHMKVLFYSGQSSTISF